MLIINNKIVEELLDMQTCIDVQEDAFRGLATRSSVMRPRIDVYVPCDFEDSYYRWGSTEGACNGFFATRIKSDIMNWPRNDSGEVTIVMSNACCSVLLCFHVDNFADKIHDCVVSTGTTGIIFLLLKR